MDMREVTLEDDRYQPVWEGLDRTREPSLESCRQGEHTWVAAFFQSGHLAYWQCEGCGKSDRETELGFGPTGLPRRLAQFNGWVESPAILVARGPAPPVSTRRWLTAEGSIPIEDDPSSIHHVGLVIPELPEAHTYRMCDANGTVEALYEPARQRMGKYSDHYWLTRYQVVGDSLVRFVSHCFEESTYDSPSSGKPKQETVLSGLRSISE